MKHILAPTDFSGRSAIAAERALSLAALSDARVTFLHVVDDDQPPAMIEAAQREAGVLLAAIGASRPGVKVGRLVKVGDAFEEISGAAEETGADLIVLGAHRKKPLRDAFIGTTAERTIRVLRQPALVVRTSGEGRYARPLAALDLVHDELDPWRRAAALNILDAAGARIVFAYEAGTYHLLRKANAGVKAFENYFAEERQKVLPSVSKAMSSLGLLPDQAILQPIVYSAHDTICDVAARQKSDLIVVGARRKSAFDRFMLGSVSSGVLRRSDIDVLVIPPS